MLCAIVVSLRRERVWVGKRRPNALGEPDVQLGRCLRLAGGGQTLTRKGRSAGT